MVVERASDGSWSVEQIAPGGPLLLEFVGPTSTASFNEFLAALGASMPEGRATLVFDLRRLEGYNPETKDPMKAWLRVHKLAIAELVVVVRKSETILKMVTAAIGLAVGVKISIREEPVEASLTNVASL
jgi:hypothetical protein